MNVGVGLGDMGLIVDVLVTTRQDLRNSCDKLLIALLLADLTVNASMKYVKKIPLQV
jgi:hypothetical protein